MEPNPNISSLSTEKAGKSQLLRPPCLISLRDFLATRVMKYPG